MANLMFKKSIHPIFKILPTLLLLTACTGESTKNTTTEYYTAFRQGFTEATQASCVDSAGNTDDFTQNLCRCVAKNLADSLSENEMNEFSQTGRQPQDMDQRRLQAVQTCNQKP